MSERGRRAAMVALLVVALCYAVKDVLGGTVYRAGTPYDAYMRVFAISRLILVVIAALIARKPALTQSDALLFWGIGGLSLDVFWQYVPPGAVFWFSAVLAHAAIGFGMAQLARYAAADHPDPKFRRAVTIWAVAIGATIAVAGFAPVALAFGSVGGRMLDQATFLAVAPWLDRIRWLGMLAGCAAIEIGAVAALRRSPPERRAHGLLVVAAFAPLVLATSSHAVVRVAGAHDVAIVRNLDALGNVLTAVLLAYGVLSKRLVDVEFYVSAAVAAALAGAALTVLGFLGEHFFVPWVGDYVEGLPFLAHYAPAVRIGAHLITAFAAYIALTKVYDEAGPLVRNAIFHHREEHLRALREFAEEVATIDPAHVGSAVVDAVIKNTAALFAGLYRRDGTGFTLVNGVGEPAPGARIVSGDARVPASLRPQVADDGSASFAMPGAREISGFLLCGPKRDATEYAADELRALGLVAREAAVVLAPP